MTQVLGHQVKLSRAERRKLDQIETCYKQYKPAQIFHCAAMESAGCENPFEYDPNDDDIKLMYACEPCAGCLEFCGECGGFCKDEAA